MAQYGLKGVLQVNQYRDFDNYLKEYPSSDGFFGKYGGNYLDDPELIRAFNEYVKNDTYPVYAVYDDGTEELIELYSDDDPPEELVGGPETPLEESEATQILTVTKETIAVPRASEQENDYRFVTSYTPVKTGYHLLGVVGFRVLGTSNVVPFRVAYESGVVTVGLRNVTTTQLNSVNLKLYLLWMADSWTTEQPARTLLQAPAQEGNEDNDDELYES